MILTLVQDGNADISTLLMCFLCMSVVLKTLMSQTLKRTCKVTFRYMYDIMIYIYVPGYLLSDFMF